MINWSQIKHFSAWEFADPNLLNSGDLIDYKLVIHLSRLRECSGLKIVTHWAVGGCVDVYEAHGHAANSYHLKRMGCKACDFHFEDDLKVVPNLRMQYAMISQAGFHGIGYYLSEAEYRFKYPIWWHVDQRLIEETQIWKKEEGKYINFL